MGGLHIVATASTAASVIQMRQLNARDVVDGVVWTIIVPAGTVQDRFVPVGTYRVTRILQSPLLGMSRPAELPTPLIVRPLSEGSLSGTLQLE